MCDATEWQSCKESTDGSANSEVSNSCVIAGLAVAEQSATGATVADDSFAKSLGLSRSVEVQEVLGRGSFTTVCRCKMEGVGDVAVKVFQMNTEFRPELFTLLKMRHPNIVNVIEVLDNVGSKRTGVALVLELCFGNFHELLHESLGNGQRRADCLFQRLQATGDIIDAVEYLHGYGILHRDICPKNCFLSVPHNDVRVDIGPMKLGEFTTAKTVGKKMTCWTGSIAYMAPEEMDEHAEYDFAADIYACGIFLYEAACKARPYGVNDTNALFALKIYQGRRPNLEYVPSFAQLAADASNNRAELIGLMQQSWQFDSELRPSITEMKRRLQDVISACAVANS